jgi:tripartite-type tricarboxylate transporter receptor subunit TctC
MAVALMVCSSARADEPTDFYQALRQAFEWTLNDPEFRAEADRLALEIDLVTGETLQAMVERMFGSLREVVEAARRAIGQG